MIDTNRAVTLNRRYMKSLNWQSEFEGIAELLGFANECPGEHAFAEAVATWQAAQAPPLGVDGIIGPNTWVRMQPALNVCTASPATAHLRRLSAQLEGPQSFAPAVPGTIPLDTALVDSNRDIEKRLLEAAEAYYQNGDFRWFFAYAHGQITRQININIRRFQRPNVLMRLNAHFAEEFLRAVNGQPHDAWKRAFRSCQALQNASDSTSLLMGEVEFCGAAMAKVHIAVDLRAALLEIGCIPPDDYGNMLILVNRGSLAAIVKLRGRALGAAEAMLQQLVAPMLELEVKVWRNAAYHSVCNAPVPDPSSSFMR